MDGGCRGGDLSGQTDGVSEGLPYLDEEETGDDEAGVGGEARDEEGGQEEPVRGFITHHDSLLCHPSDQA